MEAARIISLPGQPDTEPVRKISEDSASGQLENVRIILTKTTVRSLEEILGQAEKKGDLRGAKRVMAIFGSLVIRVEAFLFENQYIMMFYGSLTIHICPSCCLFMNGQTKNIPGCRGIFFGTDG